MALFEQGRSPQTLGADADPFDCQTEEKDIFLYVFAFDLINTPPPIPVRTARSGGFFFLYCCLCPHSIQNLHYPTLISFPF